jgi:acyl-ACP thioesterase
MVPLFEKVFTVHYYELDEHGLVRPTTYLNYLQDAAGGHARRLGVAVADLRELRLTWVLSRIHLVIDRYLRREETVTVRTWPSSREGRFSCREFELFDRQGEIVARATSSWAVLDVVSRRPIRLDRLPVYPLTPRRAVADDFATLPKLARADAEEEFTVRRYDLDVNRHANNVAYVNWALEAVPAQLTENFRLASLEVGYRAEAFAGDRVLARVGSHEQRPGPVMIHQLLRSDGTELTRMRSRWRAVAD